MASSNVPNLSIRPFCKADCPSQTRPCAKPSTTSKERLRPFETRVTKSLYPFEIDCCKISFVASFSPSPRLNPPDRGVVPTPSTTTPIFAIVSAKVGIRAKIPMDPVIVVGDAQTSEAVAETQYPPEAAKLPMETITGLPASFARSTSSRMTSDPIKLPPGLSTRSTNALTSLSNLAALMWRAMVSPPTTPEGCSPAIIVPDATIIAISSPKRDVCSGFEIR